MLVKRQNLYHPYSDGLSNTHGNNGDGLLLMLNPHYNPHDDDCILTPQLRSHNRPG